MIEVDVYWNTRKRLFSVRARSGRLRGKVIGHAKRVIVRDPEFVVGKAVQAKVRETGQKQVHAYVRGALEAYDWAAGGFPVLFGSLWTKVDDRYRRFGRERGKAVTYNPLKDDHFITARGQEIHQDGMACLSVVRGKRPEVLAFEPCEMPEVN